MTTSYDLLLDLYPLLETFPELESYNLAERIRQLITDLVLVNGMRGLEKERKRKISELRLLLSLAKDLGYLDLDVYDFLDKKFAELETI